MRSLKSTRGLTHGSGMSEQQRAYWTMSSHITSEYNNSMQAFTDLLYTTSGQHKDLANARMKLDIGDLKKINDKLAKCSPFSSDPTLRNIVTCIAAHESVNVHEYETVGRNIIQKMIGQPVFTLSLRRKDKVITIGQTSAVSVTHERTIDSALLFQRFLVVTNSGELSMEEIMKYELSTFPPAIFEGRNFLRKAEKPQLANAIYDHANDVVLDCLPKTDRYVLDGGSLLHRIPWTRGDSYGKIAQIYADFTIQQYGSATTVVFDGYEEVPSIKDNTHQRRGHNIHPVVSFNAETVFSGKKEEFLSRDVNKKRLIQIISDKLRD